MQVAVITLSDRAFNGTYEDKSGTYILQVLNEHADLFDNKLDTYYTLIPDEKDLLAGSIRDYIGHKVNYIITTGGTGISDRDITVDVTADFIRRELPGLQEVFRTTSYAKGVKSAVFSRGLAGVCDNNTIIINMPGSSGAVKDFMEILLPIMKHGVDMLAGGKH